MREIKRNVMIIALGFFSRGAIASDAGTATLQWTGQVTGGSSNRGICIGSSSGGKIGDDAKGQLVFTRNPSGTYYISHADTLTFKLYEADDACRTALQESDKFHYSLDKLTVLLNGDILELPQPDIEASYNLSSSVGSGLESIRERFSLLEFNGDDLVNLKVTANDLTMDAGDRVVIQATILITENED